MISVFRVTATILFVGLLAMVPALGEDVLVDLYPVYPSGGSGVPRVMSGGGTAVLDVVTIDSGPAPLGAVTPPGPLTPTATITFTGATRTPSIDGGFSYKPPDTHHAVGPGALAAGRIVHVTNKGIQIYDKSAASTSVAGPLDLDAFLTGLAAAGLSAIGVANLSFDPKVIYDQHSMRFFVVILDGKTPGVGGRSNVHICTSKSSTPGTLTGADWTVETASALTTFGPDDTWFDYPSLGYPFNRTGCRLRRWMTLVLARTIRGPWASSRPGSAPMRTVWTTWSGCVGPLASPARTAATMVAGGWAMGASGAPGAAAVVR